MRKLVAIVVLGAMLIAVSPLTAHAHGAALALAAFAAFTTLFALPIVAAATWYPPYYAYPAPAYAAPPAYYAQPPVSYAPPPVGYAPPPAPAIQREVVYPHGRHLLYGDGVRTAYQWVWVPNAPTPPPPPGPLPPSR
jgi:hypothetical protein